MTCPIHLSYFEDFTNSAELGHAFYEYDTEILWDFQLEKDSRAFLKQKKTGIRLTSVLDHKGIGQSVEVWGIASNGQDYLIGWLPERVKRGVSCSTELHRVQAQFSRIVVTHGGSFNFAIALLGPISGKEAYLKSVAEFTKQPMPKSPTDGALYVKDVEIKGVHVFRRNANLYLSENCHEIEIEEEPGNPHDRNAIAVFGVSYASGQRHRRQLGYVPRPLATRIERESVMRKLLPSLDYQRIYNDFMIIRFSLFLKE